MAFATSTCLFTMSTSDSSRGTDLDDRDGMLQGTGKAMRHISLKTLADLHQSGIRRYLQAARRDAGLTRSPRGEVVTRVKPQAPARRTPLRSTLWWMLENRVRAKAGM